MFILTMSLQVQPMTGRVLELPTLPGRLSHLLYRMPSLSSAGTYDFLIRPSTVSTGLAEMSAFLPVPLSLALSLSLSLSLSRPFPPAVPLSLSLSLCHSVTCARALVQFLGPHSYWRTPAHTRAPAQPPSRFSCMYTRAPLAVVFSAPRSRTDHVRCRGPWNPPCRYSSH